VLLQLIILNIFLKPVLLVKKKKTNNLLTHSGSVKRVKNHLMS